MACSAGWSVYSQWAADGLRWSLGPGGAASGNVTISLLDLSCVTELHKHMDDQSVAQRQSSSLGSSSFAALTVLALCFMLSVLGRGLSESFTVFLLPISETFGWNRWQIISIY